MLNMQAMGTNFNWTLNQEIVFSAALSGKPVRKEDFSQYCWKRCVIGTSRDYAMALYKDDWDAALRRGDLSMLRDVSDEALIFCPANNTEYLNMAAYLEAFWGYIWPTLSHNHEPQLGPWAVPKHGGLKEFIDHVISVIGWTISSQQQSVSEEWQRIL